MAGGRTLREVSDNDRRVARALDRAVSTVVFSLPAFLLISIGTVPATLAGLALVAFPVAFFVAILASALPALFPTAHRYSAMGIAYNFA